MGVKKFLKSFGLNFEDENSLKKKDLKNLLKQFSKRSKEIKKSLKNINKKKEKQKKDLEDELKIVDLLRKKRSTPGYSEMDFTSVLKNDEDIISSNIIRELKQIEKNSTNAVNLEADVSEFLKMAEANLIGKGYYFEYNFSATSPNDLNYNLTIKGRNIEVKYRP